MARKKEKKWKYKFLSESEFEEYKLLSKDALIEALKERAARLEQFRKDKKNSEALKDFNGTIREHRADWSRNNEIEDLAQQIKDLKAERDQDIEDELEAKKDVAGALQDAIKASEEHRDAMLFALRFHK